MKIFAVSDLHLSSAGDKPMEIFGSGWENHWEKISADWDARVSDEDIVLIAGDISWAMRLENAAVDLKEIAKRKGKKILIRGNHDYWWESLKKIRGILPPDMYILQNDALRLDRYVFAGSRGWTVPENKDKAAGDDIKLYERERIRMEMSLQNAAKIRKEGDVMIAMIHFPPFNSRFEDSYFTELFNRFQTDAVVYGHLHGDRSRIKPNFTRCGVSYYLTSCDLMDFRLTELTFPGK